MYALVPSASMTTVILLLSIVLGRQWGRPKWMVSWVILLIINSQEEVTRYRIPKEDISNW